MQLTFELISVVMSDTFWVANPPILMALCVAVEASLDADEENNDQPYNKKFELIIIEKKYILGFFNLFWLYINIKVY